MAKRSKDDGIGVDHLPVEVNTVEFSGSENEVVPTVRLRLMRSIELRASGKITGTPYHWSGAGSEVDVFQPDVESLLARGVYKSCCGSIGTPYFEIV